MCAKQLWKNDISKKDAAHWLESLLKNHFYGYFSLFHTFCNQVLHFFVSGTFAASGLKTIIFNKNFAKVCLEKN